MADYYKALYKEGVGEITEKKSRFIASVYPVKDEKQAQEHIDAVKKKYWDARHNCYAYVTGKNNDVQRYSDDGEPQGTAGKPILEVILNEGIHDCLIIVTRYFGGILLGTGGLLRAYQAAAKEGLLYAGIIENRRGMKLSVICDYPDAGKVQYIAQDPEIFTEASVYGADVEFVFLADTDKAKSMADKITEVTAGRALVEEGDEIWFGVCDGKVICDCNNHISES